MTTDTEARGGADWELGEAARKLTEALGTGEAAAIEAAMRDHAAAVGSKSTQMIAGLFGPLMKGQQETRDAIAALAEQNVRIDLRQQNADVASLQWRTDLREHIDGRFDHFGTELDAVNERLASLGGLEARVERVEVGQAKLEIRVDAVETHGMPAGAVDELHLTNRRLTRLEVWAAILTIAVTANALIYILIAIGGGGR